MYAWCWISTTTVCLGSVTQQMILSLAVLLSAALKNYMFCNIKQVKERQYTLLLYCIGSVWKRCLKMLWTASAWFLQSSRILSISINKLVPSFQYNLIVTLTILTVVSFVYGLIKWRAREGRGRESENESTVSPRSEKSLYGYKERWHVWLHLCLIEFSAPLS